MSWKDYLPWNASEKDEPVAVINDAASEWADSPANPELYPENSINYVPGNNLGIISEYQELYEENWLARHIIDFPIEGRFRPSGRVWPDKYKRAMESEEEKLDYKVKVIDALTTADVDGGVLIVMFVNNQTDMSSTFGTSTRLKKGDLLKIEVFDMLMVNKKDIEEINPAFRPLSQAKPIRDCWRSLKQ